MALHALEPRMLFDGALATTVDVVNTAAQPESVADAQVSADASAEPADDHVAAADSLTAAPAGTSTRVLLVIDPTVTDWQLLVSGVAPDTQVLVLDPQRDGLMQIADAMAGEGGYSSVQLVSHGAQDGRVLLGNQTLDVAALSSHAAQLSRIGAALQSSGDILLYGCNIASGPAGQLFLQSLAAATGADVAASLDDTGTSRLGGDWTLESATGVIESSMAVSDASRLGYDHVLAAGPSVTLTMPPREPLIGESFTFTATFSNTGTDTGYAPYIDLFVPASGADGGATPDGLTITGASYLGAALNRTTITLTASDIANGTVAHPYYTDAAGSHLVSIAPGMKAGDQLVVLQLPFGSFTPGQPALQVDITASVSGLADVGTPLSMVARGGFQYGADALDNPTSDPTIQGATISESITPALYRLTTTYIGLENETATGPNYQRAYRIDVDIADGQTISNLDLSSILSPGMQYVPISGTPTSIDGVSLGAAPPSGWTNVNGVMLSGAGLSLATPGLATPGGTVTRELTSAITGTLSTTDASMVVQFYVPRDTASLAPVLDAASGDAVVLTEGSAVSGNWTPLDARDAATPIALTDAAAHLLTARAIATSKTEAIVNDTGAAGLSPGDTLRFTVVGQVSDYFGLGGNAAGTDLVMVDTMSDGLSMLDASTSPSAANPVLTLTRNGVIESYTLVRGVNYTVTLDAQGREQMVVNLRSALPVVGNGQLLLGDLFNDAAQQGATTLSVVYDAQVNEAFRVYANDEAGDPAPSSPQQALNNGDRVSNSVTIGGTVLDATLDPTAAGLLSEADSSRLVDRISSNPVTLALTSINGVAVTGAAHLSPGDVVTYQVSYSVPSGDFENLSLSAFLPLPVLSAIDPLANGGNAAFTSAGGVFDPTPAAGQYSITTTGGDGLGIASVLVVADGASNGLRFDLGDRVDTSNQFMTITIAFSVRVSSQPFADNLQLTAQAAQAGQNTAAVITSSTAIAQFTLNEPVLSLYKGVVGDDVITASSLFDPVYSGADPSPLVRAAGDTAANPLLASGTPATVSALDIDVANVDAGDTLRFAIMVTNTGTSSHGAFDVVIRDQLPSNIDPSTLSNLQVVRGDGTVVAYQRVGGGAATVADLFAAGIELVDPSATQGAINGTLDALGNPVPAGSNVVFVMYDAKVAPGAPVATGASSIASLTQYSGSEGGADYAPTDLTDAASVSTALPMISKIITGSDRSYTGWNGATGHEEVVIGEIVDYQVTLTIPEGVTSAAQFIDQLDPGLSFVQLTSVVASPGLSFTQSLAGFPAVTPTDVNGGTANRIAFDFGTVTNADTDNAVTQTITLTYRAVMLDKAANQVGTLSRNVATLDATSLAVSASAPYLEVVEPNVYLTSTPSVTSADAGDLVTYTVTLSSNGRTPAFDVAFSDLVPAGMTYVAGSLSQSAGPAALTLNGTAGGTLSGSWAQLDPGQVVTLTFQATIDNSVTINQTLNNNSSATWTSIPGAASDLSPYLSGSDTERTGTGGVNDYRMDAASSVGITTLTPVLTMVASSESSTAGTSVAVGEVVRYRMVVQLPEASLSDVRLAPTLPAGLRFLNDGTITVAFVADGASTGIDSSTLSGAALDQTGGGSQASDINGIAATQQLDASAITDASGALLGAGVQASGTSPVFRLGNLVNTDRDANSEFVVIEFDVVVDNMAVNQAGAGLPVSFALVADGGPQATSNTVSAGIVEPAILDLDKHVLSVVGNVITWEVTFTNTGTTTAHDLVLADDFTGSVNQTFGGAAGVAIVSAPGGTLDNSNASGLNVSIDALAVGQSVTVRYTSTVTDLSVPVPSRDATLVWTSLTEGAGGGKTLSVATDSGTMVSASTGERTGNTGDYGATANTYVDSDPAGLGLIKGNLWDDTNSYNGAIDAADPRMTSQTVQLTWAGADGLFGTGDDQVFTTVTGGPGPGAGQYFFGALPAGNYLLDAPVLLNDPVSGQVRVFLDSGAGSQVDGRIALTLTDSQTVINRDFGYVQINDAPVVSVGGARDATEDVPMSFTGADAVSVADGDAGTSTSNTVTLSVLHGSLSLTASGGTGISGNGSGTVVLTGSIADINATLASLSYLNTQNYNGPDTLTVRADDRGNTGDGNGDNLPNDPVADNLSDVQTIAITVLGVNDPPVAVSDARVTDQNTSVTGQAIVPTGAQQLAGDLTDTDPDLPYGDTLLVQGVAAGTATGPLLANVGTAVTGAYGTLTLAGNGSYTWVPGAAALALPAGSVASDVFSYTIRDAAGATSTAQITITVNGLNDAVTAQPDTRSTGEDAPPLTGNAVSGDGVAGGQPGDQLDPDLDAGDVVTVQGVVAGSTTSVLSANVGTAVSGSYGSLTLNADGTYTYTTDARAQPLLAGQTVQDVFSYTVRDPSGTTATTTITIDIAGADDPVIANPDLRTIDEPPTGVSTPLTGNVVTAPNVGELTDTSVDPVPITVAGVTAGTAVGPLSAGTGSVVTGSYGTLVLTAGGDYVYTPDARAQTIPAGTTVSEVFTYTVTVPNGDTSTTSLTIMLVGANDGPLANPDANQVDADAAAPATGNVIGAGSAGDVADSDVDAGDVLTVSGLAAGTASGPVTGQVGLPVAGQHGTLVLGADGHYSYDVDRTDPAVLALNPGDSLVDVFTYTIDDGQGGSATTSLTITIAGRSDPPAGQDKTLAVIEDQPLPLSVADFGFSDPDAGDSFQAVRIDTLPQSGVLTLNGVPVTAGQLVPASLIGQLSYLPAHDANEQNLATSPSFLFTVQDSTGLFDPQPNRLSLQIAPVNDPPTAPVVTVTIDGGATQGSPASAVGSLPAPTDPDLPTQTLTVRVDGLPDATAGQFLLADGTPLAPGMVLTPDQLQTLSFVPNQANPVLPGPNGLIDAGALRFTVDDGHGATAPGSVSVMVRPVVTGNPPRPVGPLLPPAPGPLAPPTTLPGPDPQAGLPPTALVPPSTSETPFLPTSSTRPLPTSSGPLGSVLAAVDAQRHYDDVRVAELARTGDFDPFRPWAANPFMEMPAAKETSREAVSPAREEAPDTAADCLPSVAPHRVKPVVRHAFAHKLDRPARSFSEQLNSARKPFRPPARVVPRLPAKIC